MIELKTSMYHPQINRLEKCITLVLAKCTCLVFKMKQSEKQINYVLDENELLGKGPNGTLSLVFDRIKQWNKGEKHLKITCDNAGGRNKNNTTIWFYLYLVIAGYYENIELNFMVPGLYQIQM
jgi:hypothetical protein